jgi:hypothetical protein
MGRFENMIALFAMIGSLLASMLNKRLAWTNKLGIYIQRRFDFLSWKIRVGIICGGASSNGGFI